MAFFVVGGAVLVVLALGLYRHNRLVFDILAYQPLALGVLVSAVWVVTSRFPGGPANLGFRFPGWNRLLSLTMLGLVVTFLGLALIDAVFTNFIPGYHLQGNAQQLFQGVPKHPNVLKLALILAWAAVEAPLVEETLFRGMVFQGVRNFAALHVPYWAAVLIAALASGAVFGLVHGELHTLPILIFLGIVLAYVFEASRSIYASTLLHGTINAFAVANTFGLL
jgi:membrane protease YdiL (CAAX protease family)